ncbi:hypothetical protein ACIA49_28505 [Kribbella sp. NPDC051587]|uniref:hypothetical protein n=1 Tax=Kribbella sp. NPDC051587 TaxID=3364119 RepID=UPI0037A78888
MSSLNKRLFLLAAGAAVVLGVQPGAADAAGLGDGTTAGSPVAAARPSAGPAAHPRFQAPNSRQYYITASCRGWESQIRDGASTWIGLTETTGSGTPVSCQNGYVDSCNAGSRIIGCNWGSGQRITLAMNLAPNPPLLAAHEFGHDWYGHSSSGCQDWNSVAGIMKTLNC